MTFYVPGDLVNEKSILVKGAFILTLTGIITRVLGFFYRIFLSRVFGEEAIGLYQLIFPIYALVSSFTSAGIQTALSRITARKTALNKSMDAYIALYISLFFSVLLSILCLSITQQYSTFIAKDILNDSRCDQLLILISYAFPFGAIHGCICGYYLGKKKTMIPSSSLLIEQMIRIGCVILLYYFFSAQNKYPGIILAVIGLAIGEMSSSVFCLFFLHREYKIKLRTISSFNRIKALTNELIRLSIPLTANRVMLNILQSIEAVSIPLKLKSFGYDSSNALSIYGVFTGMALPCILFPSAVSNAIASMMLPIIAEMQANKNQKQMSKLIKKVGSSCTILGILCCAFLLLFGNTIGNYIFHSVLAGKFITTLAWICPFLYTNSNLISILNGLGKANISLLFNSINLMIRIVSTFLFIPRFGMEGYLWGLLFGQLILFFLCIFYIFRMTKKVTQT